MAQEIVRRGKKERSGKNQAVGKGENSARPKHAKRAKKHAKKSAKRMGRVAAPVESYAVDHGLMTAFHHMQRASVVMSLMAEGTGKDLRRLLERGVKLYGKAVKDGAKDKFVLRAIGVLRAAEHLSMAGLYEARKKHRQRVTSPTPEWLVQVVAETGSRLDHIDRRERDKGMDLFPVSVELLRQAKETDIDAHMAFELAMAADALCFALENGL
jgi:hypothetical protein